MKLIRVAVTSALSAAALSGIGSAAADYDVFGTYSFAAEDGENATWTMTPCAGDPPGCVRVSETGNAKRAPWAGDAHWSVGSLILVVGQPDAILCEDGTSVPGLNTYSWNGATLSGNASILTNGACGAEPSVSIPFQLTRLGAAEAQPPAAPPALPTPPAGGGPAGPPATPPAAPETPPAPPLAAESTAGPAGVPAAPPAA